MNASRRLMTIAGLAMAGVFFVGCDDRAEDTAVPPAETPTDTAPAARTGTPQNPSYASPSQGPYTDERRDQFVEAAEEQYQALEEELAALAAEAEARGDAAVARFDQVRPTLETQLSVVEQRLDSVRGATAATWATLEREFMTAMTDVRASFAEARRAVVGNTPTQPTNPGSTPPANRPTNPPTNPPSNPPAPPG